MLRNMFDPYKEAKANTDAFVGFHVLCGTQVEVPKNTDLESFVCPFCGGVGGEYTLAYLGTQKDDPQDSKPERRADG